jgi:hypothetical protein
MMQKRKKEAVAGRRADKTKDRVKRTPIKSGIKLSAPYVVPVVLLF